MTPEFSIVIPAYNEEQRLGPMLDVYAPYFFSKYGPQMEFVIIVNGSHDRTEEIAAGYARTYEQIRVVVEPRAIGKGGAIMLGFRHASGRWVGFVDADGSTPP
ncbi:MAG: glycosyltransferase, partial [Lentisphaerota bacterium]